MGPLNSPPPDFKAVYFDTNALLGTGWPDPLRLAAQRICNRKMVGNSDVSAEPVVKEAEEHWLRVVKEQATRADSAARELQRVAKSAVCDAKAEHPSIELLH